MKLNVITTVSNPCNYESRYRLAKNFIEYISSNPNINLYLVELAYSCNNKYVLTSSSNPKHLRLLSDTPIWHKENLINIGVKHLLPNDWDNFSWIDADIDFLNKDWANETLDGLKKFDVLQMFSFCHDLDKNLNIKKVFSSLCQSYCLYGKGRSIQDATAGFAWAINRSFYEKIGGLFEYGVIGGADLFMYNCFSGELTNDVLSPYFFLNNNYKKNCIEYFEKCKNCRLGFLPFIIKHYFHGERTDRKYLQRNKILLNHKFDIDFLQKDKYGLLEPSDLFKKELKDDFLNYFFERKED